MTARGGEVWWAAEPETSGRAVLGGPPWDTAKCVTALGAEGSGGLGAAWKTMYDKAGVDAGQS